MEPEGSLPHSQVPATRPYPEPDRSIPHPNILKIHLNIILPSTSGSPKWSLFFRLPHQNPVYASPLPHTGYIPRPSHSSRFYHPGNIGWGVHRSVTYINNQQNELQCLWCILFTVSSPTCFGPILRSFSGWCYYKNTNVIKYIINIVVHSVRYWYIMDLFNAWKTERINLLKPKTYIMYRQL